MITENVSNILFFPPNLKASGQKSVIEKLNVRKTETTINCCSNTLKENNMKSIKAIHLSFGSI